MADLRLTLAVNDYDHVRDLVTGRVRAEGIDLTCLNLSVEEIFYPFHRVPRVGRPRSSRWPSTRRSSRAATAR
jgi:hypothetical protein